MKEIGPQGRHNPHPRRPCGRGQQADEWLAQRILREREQFLELIDEQQQFRVGGTVSENLLRQFDEAVALLSAQALDDLGRAATFKPGFQAGGQNRIGIAFGAARRKFQQSPILAARNGIGLQPGNQARRHQR